MLPRSCVSFGDLIDLEPNFVLCRDRITFNQLFYPDLLSESELSRPNRFQRLKKRLKCSKSIDFNQKEIKLDQK